MSAALAVLPFHGDKIVTFEADGEPHVAMRRIVENLGMQWPRQHARLIRQADKFSCTPKSTTGADGKQYEMLSIPVCKLPLWLASISPSRVAPEVRAKLELYQAESAIALHDYWTKGIAVRPDLEGIVTGLEPSVMAALGGLVRGVVRKVFTEAAPAMVEAAIQAAVNDRLTSCRLSIVESVSALEVAELAGYGRGERPKGLTHFISRRLTRYHEDRGLPVNRSRHGSSKVKLFDEAAAREWLRHGGGTEVAQRVAEQRGQGRLKLDPPE